MKALKIVATIVLGWAVAAGGILWALVHSLEKSALAEALRNAK